MKKNFTIYTILALLVFACLPPATVKADVYNSCTPYNYSLRYGTRGGDVLRLQSFLISYGYLGQGSATGYFGSMTYSAVRRFQASNGIPSTGFVGSITRNFIYSASCNTTYPDPVPPIPPVTQSPVISSLSPSYGPFGTVVTIYGNNFSRTGNNAINFAGVNNIATGVVSNDGTSLQFTVPASPCPQGQFMCTMVALAPGQYQISVTTPSGTSNNSSFTVTDYGSNNGNAPVINGVEGPTSLSVNQEGRWTVRATESNGRYLNYAVSWGDTQLANGGYSYSGSNTSGVQSTSFTHTYERPGTYTITFTIRSESGASSESRISVYVGGATVGVPTIYSLSPSSGPFGMPVTVTGRNFSRYNNNINFAGVNNAYTDVPSYDGTTLQFTPTATPCASGTYCAQSALSTGDYNVSVSNQNGASNVLTYRATSGNTSATQQTLALGQTGDFGNGLRIMPTAINEDSRCPANVNCIQAGRVAVQLNINTNSTSRSVVLATDGGEYTADDGSRIRIIEVTPVKYSTGTIYTDQYRITFRVVR